MTEKTKNYSNKQEHDKIIKDEEKNGFWPKHINSDNIVFTDTETKSSSQSMTQTEFLSFLARRFNVNLTDV